MLNSDLTYRVALARIDDLQLQANERRFSNLANARLGRRKPRREGQARRVRVPRARVIRFG